MTTVPHSARQASVYMFAVNNGLKQGDAFEIPFQLYFEYAIRKVQANQFGLK